MFLFVLEIITVMLDSIFRLSRLHSLTILKIFSLTLRKKKKPIKLIYSYPIDANKMIICLKCFVLSNFLLINNLLMIGMLLVSRSGLVEEDAVEVFHYYGFHCPILA